MSFILDALKKSDKKRQGATVPRLDTVHASVKTSSRKPLWFLLLGLVLLLSLGLFGWFSQRQQPPAATATSRPSQPAEIVERQAPVALPSVPAAAKVRPQVVPQQPVSKAAAQQPSARPLSEPRIYAISELPESVQRRIPPMHMSLHAYNKANPAAGMVRVNERILRQGAKLDDKYLLEEISVEGAVFHFEGYRFLLPRD